MGLTQFPLEGGINGRRDQNFRGPKVKENGFLIPVIGYGTFIPPGLDGGFGPKLFGF